MLVYLLSKSINEQGGIFQFLYKKLRAAAGWKENLKDLSKHEKTVSDIKKSIYFPPLLASDCNNLLTTSQIYAPTKDLTGSDK